MQCLVSRVEVLDGVLSLLTAIGYSLVNNIEMHTKSLVCLGGPKKPHLTPIHFLPFSSKRYILDQHFCHLLNEVISTVILDSAGRFKHKELASYPRVGGVLQCKL